MAIPLLATKTYLPPPAPGRVDRGRLRAQLDQARSARRRLVLVSAMAGAGKSTLLADWAAAGELPFAWVSLDAHDNNPPTFWAYLVAALQGPAPGFGGSLLAELLSPQPPPGERVLLEFLNQAAGLAGRTVLVLDDYHLIENAAIHESLVYLVEHLPESLLLVICTRSDPPAPLSRWRVRGYLVEIRLRDLRFTTEETGLFLRDFMALNVDEEDVARLEASTEGWAAGLQLAALALQGGAGSGGLAQKEFIARFSANHHYVLDYLTSEVLSQQPPEVHEFLLQTSILKQLSGPLCSAVTGDPNSPEILAALNRKNLFVIPQDDEGVWFRYHHLFAELLRLRLKRRGAEAVAQLHLRAAHWHEQAGRVDDLLYHALEAGAVDYAAETVNRNWRRATDEGWPNVALGWLEALPVETLRGHPMLSMAAAWTQWIRGQAETAQKHGLDAQQAYERWLAQGAGAQEDYEFATIPCQVAALQALVAVRFDRLEEAVGFARQAIEMPQAKQPFALGLAYMALATALRDLGRIEEAIGAYQQAIGLLRTTGNRITVANSSFNLGRLLQVQGRLSAARQVYEQTLAWTGESGRTPAIGILQVGLADVHYERNELAQAAGLHERAWGQANRGGYLELIKNGSILLARLRRAGGDWAGARAALQEGLEIVQRTDARALLDEIQAVLAVYLAETGELEAARRLADAAPLEVGEQLPRVSSGFQRLHLARVHLAAGRVEAVLGFAERFERLAEAAGSRRWQMEAGLLQALAHAQASRPAAARAALLRSLELAQPEGYLRLFVDGGVVVQELLVAIYPEVRDEGLAGFVGRILEAFPAGSGGKGSLAGELVEPLSEREVQVLRLLSVGLSNQAVAGQLVISLATVKTHVRHIFEKLGAANRVEAIQRARDLGLL